MLQDNFVRKIVFTGEKGQAIQTICMPSDFSSFSMEMFDEIVLLNVENCFLTAVLSFNRPQKHWQLGSQSVEVANRLTVQGCPTLLDESHYSGLNLLATF